MTRTLALVLMAGLMGWLPGQARADNLTCTVNDYPPFVSPRLPDKGFFWAIAKAALEHAGHKARLEFRTWVRAMANVKKGKRDCLVAMVASPAREKLFLFSDPVASAKVGFFKNSARRDIRFTGDLKSIAKYTIGVIKGYSVTPEFDTAAYLKKREVRDSILALKDIYTGRLDLFAGTHETDHYRMERQLIANPMYKDAGHKIVFMEPPLAVSLLRFAVLKARPGAVKLIAEFNAGLKAVKADGTYRKILERHGIEGQGG